MLPRARWAVAAAMGLVVACAPSFSGGRLVKDTVSYRVPPPEDRQWRRLGFADNDLAWVADATGHVLAVNATCKDHGDPSLEVLTQHLVFGFTDRVLKSQLVMQVDGREALRSAFTAKLDGVPMELTFVVLKKNGCVHDFTYIAPEGQRATHEASFDALVAGFAQEPR